MVESKPVLQGLGKVSQPARESWNTRRLGGNTLTLPLPQASSFIAEELPVAEPEAGWP